MKNISRLLAAAGLPVVALLGFANPASAAASITVTPSTGLAAGGTVTITGAGFAPGDQPVMAICVDVARQAGATLAPLLDCDNNTQTQALDVADASGAWSDTFTLPTGAMSTGAVCNATTPCRIRVSTGTFANTAVEALFDVTYAAVVTTTTTTVDPNATTTTTVDPNATTTTTVDPNATTTTIVVPPADVPEAPLTILLPLGAALVLGAGYTMVRKGRTTTI